jgi:acetyltransferase EpsM
MEHRMAKPVQIPLLNPNEPEALIAEMYVVEGQLVRQGDPLCSLETTKSTAEMTAEAGGYVRGLNYSQGQSVRAGELFCYLAGDPQWEPPKPAVVEAQAPEGVRLTRPAMELAQRLDLDLSILPTGTLITEAILRQYASSQQGQSSETRGQYKEVAGFDPTAILIYGGGGHGKMVVDLLRARGGYRLVGFIDDGLEAGSMVMGLPVLGGAQRLPELHTQGTHMAVNAVGGIGDIRIRIKIFERLAEAGFACPSITHPRAYVDPSASLETGSQVLAMAYVGSEAKLGYGCIVNTGAIVSHDCRLGNFTIISPGALLAGEVEVGEATLIGMGATLNLGVKIGKGARVGNGATVKANVPEAGVVRAGTIWPA